MSVALTLFGDEPEPEQVNAVGKSRAVKKADKKEAKPGPEPQPMPEKVPDPPAPKPKAVKKVKEVKAIKEKTVKETPKPASTEKPAILAGWKAEKQYYSIGEVSALFAVNTSHIRFWTKEFALRVRTTKKGDRLYTPDQVLELRAIYHLVKERGFTISGAKAQLKASKKVSVETIDLKQSLLQLRNKLLLIRNQIA